MSATETPQTKEQWQGYLAYYANETAETCPYGLWTRGMVQWVIGFALAEMEVEATHGPNGALLLPMAPPQRPA